MDQFWVLMSWCTPHPGRWIGLRKPIPLHSCHPAELSGVLVPLIAPLGLRVNSYLFGLLS